jgi:hypothetical protein
MWEGSRMPWVPELFTAPVLQQILDKRRRDELVAVPFFPGLLAGEPDALIASFTGEPELHDPMRGRVKGKRAFADYIASMSAWLVERNATIEDVTHVILADRGFEEVVLHVDSDHGRVGLPFAVVADHPSGERLDELRLYYSTWPLTHRHAIRPPLLQRDAQLRVPDVLAEHLRALEAGDIDALVAAFEPDGYVREPAGADAVHSGPDTLRTFYESWCSNGGGIRLEACALVDDGRTCALEYNLVRWGVTELLPQAGVAVFARGPAGALAAARVYDDADPPLATVG